MATVQWSFSTRSSLYRWNHYLLASTSNATDGASDYEFYNFADKVNSIPDYSKINSVIFWTRMGASIGKNEGYVKINGSGGTKFCEGSGGTDWFNLKAVNSFPYVNGDTSQINLVSYCHSMTQDAGWLPNLYYYVSRQGSTGLPRNFSIELTITWDYTPPQFTVNVSAGEGGTASGGGTTACGGSRTITAKANTGYEFIGWSDGVKDNPRTITCGSPKQFQTTYNLTAQFKKLTYTVTWKNHDGTVLETDTNVEHGTTPSYNGATPTKASTAQYSYKFSGWSPAVGAISGNTTYTAQFTSTVRSYTLTVTAGTGGTVSGGGTYSYGATATLKATPNTGYKFVKWSDGNTSATRTVTVTGAATYTATFEKLKYTVTWKNDDGTVLETDNNVEYGTTPSYNGATPTKASTAQHAYTFSGWSPSVSAVTGNVTYTAQFTSTVRKYTVKWYNYDGTLLETDTDVPYGTKPTYNGATPTKPSDDYYTYGFAGWSPSTDEAIQGDKNFTAQFAQTDRYYTVRWVNASAVQGTEGALLETDTVKFNTQPDYNGATPKHPKQDSDPAFNYDFIGWSAKVTDPAKPDTELEKVKGNITYTAIYETTPKLYAITVILFDSQSTDIYEYGTEVTIEAPEIVDFHRFIKWSDGDTRRSRPITVTAVATYQAIYERIPVPVKVNKEQVTGCYIVPTTKTIVYVISGTVPTVETKRESVDGWSFLVSNSIPENGYLLKKLFITESGVTTRVY